MIRTAPTNIVSSFALASAIGVLLVTPLAFLEFRYAATPRQLSDYAALFGLLWLLPVAFVMIGTLLVRAFRSKPTIVARPVSFVSGVIVLAVVAGVWLAVVRDQVPCFIGVPICD